MDEKRGVLPTTLSRAIETLSVATAASFVISGFFNQLYFWRHFRLNFFRIAQPSDVVMSGFVYVTSFVAAMFCIFMVFYFATLIVAINDRKHNRLTAERLETVKKLNIPEQQKKRFMKYTWERSKRSFYQRRFIVYIVIMVAMIGGLTTGILMPVTYFDSVFPPSRFSFTSTPSYPVNDIYLSRDDDLFAKCGQAPVLWMGSATVIIDCRGTIRLVQNTQALILDKLAVPPAPPPTVTKAPPPPPRTKQTPHSGRTTDPGARPAP